MSINDDSCANMASPDHPSAVPESPDQPGAIPTAMPTHTDQAGNGQRLAIDDLQGYSPDEWEVIRRSDTAFHQVRQTWGNWKVVRDGLVLLRDRAMRETGSVSIQSKRYKDRLHELLENRPYCSAKMSPSTRKDLLQSAEPEVEEWYATLDEQQRLGLNHPVTLMRAFRAAKRAKRASTKSRRAQHEAELERVRQEAAAAISSKDAQIQERDRQIEELTKQNKPAPDSACDTDADTERTDHAGAEHPDDKEDPDSARLVQYVVTKCKADQEKIREVIAGLTAYLEQRVS
jgi:hypothetical protein